MVVWLVFVSVLSYAAVTNKDFLLEQVWVMLLQRSSCLEQHDMNAHHVTGTKDVNSFEYHLSSAAVCVLL
jgi:hypothetical protein